MWHRRRSRRILISLATCALFGACAQDSQWDGSLDNLLRSQPVRFGKVTQNREAHRVQIIYTQIDRDASNNPSFTTFTYRLNADEYYYPASTVKLPTALLALEKLRRLGIDGLDRNTTMLTGAISASLPAVATDDTAPGGLPSVGHYVQKILLVSDNDAFNRLYEFIGQQALNESMHAKGYRDTRIMHRLEVTLSLAENRITNPVTFVSGDEQIHAQEAMVSDVDFTAASPIRLGRAEIVDGLRLARPKDFAEKNAFPLQDLHDVLKALIFPDSVAETSRFDLGSDDYNFVYRNMSAYPAASGIAAYADSDEYPGGYAKFLLFGGKAEKTPEHILVLNKVGDAYGFLTDAAYIVDLEHGIEFILAATVYTNENETFNDNNYEYDEIGLPFLRDLGRAIYELELGRDRAYRPDLGHIIRSEQ